MTLNHPSAAPSAVAAAILGSDPGLIRSALGAIAHEEVLNVFLVGDRDEIEPVADELGHTWVANVHDLISIIDPAITHVWMLHDDARPRRGALSALLNESLRTDASLAGSKVLRVETELESVGGSTDVFLAPYSGLTPGEIDQGQYDVVRDVAFIPGASVLIRRDLLRGLDGPDPYLAPDSQAIDLAQRARVAGGRVVVVPSSEVFHDRVCRERVPGWREQAGRYRAILKVYSWITVIWAAPLALLVGFVDAFVRLFMGDPRPLLDYGYSLAWNVKNLDSTLAGRRTLRQVRQVRDEELFLYQTRGSLALAGLGTDVTHWLRKRTGEGSALNEWVENRRGFWQEVGFVSAVAALLAVVIASRTIWSEAMPVTGYALPIFDTRNALASFAGGWNPSSLGTPASIHPTVGFVAAVQWLLAGRGPLVMTLITMLSLLAGYGGMIRLLRYFGLSAVGRAVGAWSVVLGPVAFAVSDMAYWPAAVASGLCPWAVYLALENFPSARRKRLGRVGFGLLAAGIMSMLVPFAAFIPLLVAIVWAVIGRRLPTRSRRRIQLLRSASLGLGAAVFLGPWLVWGTWDDFVFDGAPLRWEPALALVAAFGAVLLLTLLFGPGHIVEVAGTGGLLALVGLWLARSEVVGIGLEPSAAGLVLASLGVSMVLGAASSLPDHLSGSAAFGAWIIAGAALFVVAVPAFLSLIDGALGYGPDRFGESMAFAEARAEEHGADRVLYLGSDLPGGHRVMNGVAYRVASGPTAPLTEAWLSDSREGDVALENVLADFLVEGDLRPGERLAPFGIRWVVSTSENELEQAFVARLDMARLPIFDLPFTVYENLESSPRAVSDAAWTHAPAGAVWYTGNGSNNVRLAESPGPGWPAEQTPGFGVDATPSDGAVTYAADPLRRGLGWLVLAIASFSIVLAAVSMKAEQR